MIENLWATAKFQPMADTPMLPKFQVHTFKTRTIDTRKESVACFIQE